MKAPPRDALAVYLGRYRRFRWRLASGTGLAALQSLSLIPIAWFIKLTFDRILHRAGMAGLFLPCAAIFLLVALSSTCSLLARRQLLDVTKQVIADIRSELMAKAYELAATVAGVTDRSDLHTAIVQDTERLDVGSNALLGVALPSLITASIFLIALVVLAPMLLLATITAAPLAVLISLTLGRRLRTLVEGFRRSFQSFDENVLAALNRIELTQLSGAERAERARQDRFIADLKSISARMAWTATAYAASQASVTSLASVITLIIGGAGVTLGRLSLSSLAAYYFALAQLGSSLNALWNAAPQIIAGLDSLGDIACLQAAARETPVGGARVHDLDGAVELRDVWFSHGDGPLLDGVDLKLAPGQRVAITGPNGSGKSTLAHIVLGLRSPDAGQVLIDGIPLSDLSLEHYRRQIGVVLQDPMVFAGTIRENITYAAPSATRAEVDLAARLSGAARFIGALDGGYDTVIGRGGMALSGGQYQLLALTRALLGRPRLLVLDEPTNHLDEAASRALFDALDSLVPMPTVLLVTHDREPASMAARTYLLRDGRLALRRPSRALERPA